MHAGLLGTRIGGLLDCAGLLGVRAAGQIWVAGGVLLALFLTGWLLGLMLAADPGTIAVTAVVP